MNQRAADRKCLLLNADFSPLRVISWQKAIIWSIKHELSGGPVDIISYYDDAFIRGVNDKKYPLPAVAKTNRYFNLYHKSHINFSRHNLFIRDNHTCQYCGIELPACQLTYDHIIPKSRFNHNRKTSTNWTNIVTSCRKCNHKKGNRTPEEAGMVLINIPVVPKYSLKYLPWYRDLATIYQCQEQYNLWEPFLNNSKHYAS